MEKTQGYQNQLKQLEEKIQAYKKLEKEIDEITDPDARLAFTAALLYCLEGGKDLLPPYHASMLASKYAGRGDAAMKEGSSAKAKIAGASAVNYLEMENTRYAGAAKGAEGTKGPNLYEKVNMLYK
jgi:hypothetical protein